MWKGEPESIAYENTLRERWPKRSGMDWHVDTNILIDYLPGVPKATTFLRQARSAGTLWLSAITVAELYALLFERHPQRYPSNMATIGEIEKLALSLTEKERATLAANLLESLPCVLIDEDEGVAEALRRDAELESNPDQAISLAQLDTQIKSRRR